MIAEQMKHQKSTILKSVQIKSYLLLHSEISPANTWNARILRSSFQIVASLQAKDEDIK